MEKARGKDGKRSSTTRSALSTSITSKKTTRPGTAGLYLDVDRLSDVYDVYVQYAPADTLLSFHGAYATFD